MASMYPLSAASFRVWSIGRVILKRKRKRIKEKKQNKRRRNSNILLLTILYSRAHCSLISLFWTVLTVVPPICTYILHILIYTLEVCPRNRTSRGRSRIGQVRLAQARLRQVKVRVTIHCTPSKSHDRNICKNARGMHTMLLIALQVYEKKKRSIKEN